MTDALERLKAQLAATPPSHIRVGVKDRQIQSVMINAEVVEDSPPSWEGLYLNATFVEHAVRDLVRDNGSVNVVKLLTRLRIV